MQNHKPFILARLMTFLLLITLLVSGCAKPTEQAQIPTQPPITTEPTELPTALPAAPAARLLLFDPAGSAPPETTAYITNFAAENGLQLEVVNADGLTPQGEETRVALLLAEPPGLAEITAASPATQFVAIGNIQVTGQPNLSVIKTDGVHLAFMAGYLTQSIAWDWRSAGLIPNDIVMTAEKTNAFINGARYLCGVCTPFYAPIVSFPMLAQESMQADVMTWGAQVDVLRQHFVNTFFVDPAAATVETLDGLKGLESSIFNTVKLIGLSGSPNPDRFTALIGYELLPALTQLLPQVIAGSGGQTINAQVRVVSITDETVITPAKIDNFNRVAADLAAGIIIPLSMP